MKDHGMKGKTNARQGGENQTERINYRETPCYKSFLESEAEKKGLTLKEFIRSHLPKQGEENGN